MMLLVHLLYYTCRLFLACLLYHLVTAAAVAVEKSLKQHRPALDTLCDDNIENDNEEKCARLFYYILNSLAVRNPENNVGPRISTAFYI